MKYDFTTALVRRGHDSAAEDMVGSGAPNAATAPKEGFDYIPMAVADMASRPVQPSWNESKSVWSIRFSVTTDQDRNSSMAF